MGLGVPGRDPPSVSSFYGNNPEQAAKIAWQSSESSPLTQCEATLKTPGNAWL